MTQVENQQDEYLHVKEYFDQHWKTYQKILDNNYMSHHNIYSILQEFLVRTWKKPFKMLDLGCGDARFTSETLLNTSISSYHGVDLSTSALEIAKENLARVPCATTLTQGDFSQLASILPLNEQNKVDAVLISFALHHLQFEQKRDFMRQIRHLLTSDGVFLLIDIIRQPGEDRESYIQRYLDGVKQYWSLLTPAEYSLIEEHISSSDFPETLQNLAEISQQSGFTRFESLYCDRLNTLQLLCFYP